MTLEEAIKRCEEKAEELSLKAEYAMSELERTKFKECAAEHRQLAESLKELKAVHDEIFIGYLRKKMRGWNVGHC